MTSSVTNLSSPTNFSNLDRTPSQLTTLDDTIRNLTQLRELNPPARITTLSDAIANLTRLRPLAAASAAAAKQVAPSAPPAAAVANAQATFDLIRRVYEISAINPAAASVARAEQIATVPQQDARAAVLYAMPYFGDDTSVNALKKSDERLHVELSVTPVAPGRQKVMG